MKSGIKLFLLFACCFEEKGLLKQIFMNVIQLANDSFLSRCKIIHYANCMLVDFSCYSFLAFC
jgi:hypothetical protein